MAIHPESRGRGLLAKVAARLFRRRNRTRRRRLPRPDEFFLEGRVVPTSGITYVDGVLTIAGDLNNPNQNDSFQLEVDPIFHTFLQFTVNGSFNLSLLSTLT